MDLTARQYLAHHHHQAEINRALMELFHLIDIFLQSDEKARDSLTVLCLVSNYLQQKGVIGSMQAAKCDANQSINSNGDPLADLAGLIASQSLVAGSTLVNSSKRAPAQSSIHQAQFLSPSSMGIPTRYESPVERAATQRRVRTTEELPSFISVLREGVRAWLTRPTTHALRKWTYHNSSQIAPPDSRKRYERTGVGDPVQRSGQPSSVQTHPRADEISEDEFVMVDYPQMTDRPLPRPPSDYHHCSSSAMDSPGRTTSYNDVHRFSPCALTSFITPSNLRSGTEKVDRRHSLNSSDTSIVSQESMSTLRDAEEPEEEVEEIKVLPSGEVLYLSGEDLEEWKQGEEIERREREAWKTYSNELEHACEGVASSIPGGILADIARRRKSLTSSHSVGLWSSRRSGR
ncbi:SubName: Full=Uncharacterized protein {ECO:0000313/EMBL:CCA76386.1} [Serendipita indica DSM 11827]|nr:SubName: Full=Uncharacterized protein {ECO:0000313/EMBL:CCA76386.1} [Serendipita indica DSM 11827]